MLEIARSEGFARLVGARKWLRLQLTKVDKIIPPVRIRQYVLSVPIPLRYWMTSNKKLLAGVHKIFASEIESFYTKKHKKASRSGSVCCVPRFGGALNLNVHFHLLQIEGVYEEKSTGFSKFRKIKAPSNFCDWYK